MGGRSARLASSYSSCARTIEQTSLRRVRKRACDTYSLSLEASSVSLTLGPLHELEEIKVVPIVVGLLEVGPLLAGRDPVKGRLASQSASELSKLGFRLGDVDASGAGGLVVVLVRPGQRRRVGRGRGRGRSREGSLPRVRRENVFLVHRGGVLGGGVDNGGKREERGRRRRGEGREGGSYGRLSVDVEGHLWAGSKTAASVSSRPNGRRRPAPNAEG